jgi:NAD(P)-dependent dehydrogenase (short-subunit alcohol dehydrogenase family)
MKRIVITGATSGIGKALVQAFHQAGHDVCALGRNETLLTSLAQSVDDPSRIHTIQADFSHLQSIQKAAQAIQSLWPQGIDVLINNAAMVSSQKRFSFDGIEMQYQVNHLAVVALTHALYPGLVRRQGRILTTSSNAHKGARFHHKDLQDTVRYRLFRRYAQTKLYNLMFTTYCQNHSSDVLAYAIHPGVVKTDLGSKDATPLMGTLWSWFTRKAQEPQDVPPTYLKLALAEEPLPPGYYAYEKPIKALKITEDLTAVHTLMDDAFARLQITSFGVS